MPWKVNRLQRIRCSAIRTSGICLGIFGHSLTTSIVEHVAFEVKPKNNISLNSNSAPVIATYVCLFRRRVYSVTSVAMDNPDDCSQD